MGQRVIISKEVEEAALLLCELKHSKIDEATARFLTWKKKSLAKQTLQNVPLPAVTNIVLERFYQEAPRHPPVDKLRGFIGECSEPLVKRLTWTDLMPGQGRLRLDTNHVEGHLMRMIKEDEVLDKNGIEVTTYDQDGKAYKHMNFKWWADPKKFYVLNGGDGKWNAFVREHPEFHGTYPAVTLWMFRHTRTNRLCFVIIPTRIVHGDQKGKVIGPLYLKMAAGN